MPGDEPTRPVRLHKLMSERGVGSRRRCEELISAGRVSVNGNLVTELGTTSSPSDEILVDGKRLKDKASAAYIMLNKPTGCLSSVSDPHGRRTVLDLIQTTRRLYPVGRLDIDSEGLMLLTDDGDLTYRLTHPSFGVAREYHVKVEPTPDEGTLATLRAGVVIGGRRTLPAQVELVRRTKECAQLRFVIHEGRKRQLRLMCLAVGLRVERIVRVRIGPLRIGSLKAGRAPLSDARRDRSSISFDGNPTFGSVSTAPASLRRFLLWVSNGTHQLIQDNTDARIEQGARTIRLEGET